MKHILTMSALSFALFACGRANDTSTVKQEITGNDYVVKSVQTDSRLQDAVGLLTVNGVQNCHAFASGSLEVTTAAHCVSGKTISSIKFQTASGKVYDLKVKTINNQSDVAVLNSNVAFERPLEKNLGFYNSLAERNKLLTIENNQLIEQSNSPLFQNPSLAEIVFHTYDTKKGFSGAPVLDENNRIIGIHVAAVINENYNVIVKVNAFDSTGLSVQRIFELEYVQADIDRYMKMEECESRWCSNESGGDYLDCIKLCEAISKDPDSKVPGPGPSK